MMPPGVPRLGLPLVWRLIMLMFCTTTRSSSRTVNTEPRLPLSLPVITMTSSPFLIIRIARPPWLLQHRSQHSGRERHDLHELCGTELAGHGPEDTGTDGLELVVEQHRSIAVEADQRAVGAAHAFAGAHDDGVVHLALLHLAARNGRFDADLDHITYPRIAALRSTQHLNAHQTTGAAIVGHVFFCLFFFFFFFFFLFLFFCFRL